MYKKMPRFVAAIIADHLGITGKILTEHIAKMAGSYSVEESCMDKTADFSDAEIESADE